MAKTAAATDHPIVEAVSTLGLFMMVLAVIGLPVCLAALTAGSPVLAATTGVVALVSFVASMACFVVDNRRLDQQQGLVATAKG